MDSMPDKRLPFTSRIFASSKRLTSLVGQKLAISGTWRKLSGMMERTTLSQGVCPPENLSSHLDRTDWYTLLATLATSLPMSYAEFPAPTIRTVWMSDQPLLNVEKNMTSALYPGIDCCPYTLLSVRFAPATLKSIHPVLEEKGQRVSHNGLCRR